MEAEKKRSYMAAALAEAQQAYAEDEVPVGCVIVYHEQIIAAAHNKKRHKQDVTQHAEILAIQQASAYLQSWHLEECALFVTLEPCLMCTGAIVLARIKKVCFACADPKGGALVSNIKLAQIKGLNHYPQTEEGILKEPCQQILKAFFKAKR